MKDHLDHEDFEGPPEPESLTSRILIWFAVMIAAFGAFWSVIRALGLV